MTSISLMEARCPQCGTDVRCEAIENQISIGDCEDVVDFDCPNEYCDAHLTVELIARFEVKTE